MRIKRSVLKFTQSRDASAARKCYRAHWSRTAIH